VLIATQAVSTFVPVTLLIGMMMPAPTRSLRNALCCRVQRLDTSDIFGGSSVVGAMTGMVMVERPVGRERLDDRRVSFDRNRVSTLQSTSFLYLYLAYIAMDTKATGSMILVV